MQNNRQKPTLKSEKVLLVSKPDKKRVVEKNQKKNIETKKCTMNKRRTAIIYILAYTYIHLYI